MTFQDIKTTLVEVFWMIAWSFCALFIVLTLAMWYGVATSMPSAQLNRIIEGWLIAVFTVALVFGPPVAYMAFRQIVLPILRGIWDSVPRRY